MTGAGEIVITARNYRTQEANREDARARLAELIAQGPCQAGEAERDQAEPGRQGEAGRREEAARLGQAGAREGELSIRCRHSSESWNLPVFLPHLRKAVRFRLSPE